jgi:lipid A 3-O-deacylase
MSSPIATLRTGRPGKTVQGGFCDHAMASRWLYVTGKNAAVAFTVKPVGDTLRQSPTGVGHAGNIAEGPLRDAKVGVALSVVLLFALWTSCAAEERPFTTGSRTRGLTGGWGVGYRPPWAPTRSDVAFGAFQPRMGWFVTDWLELYGEGTLFLYTEPSPAISAGVGGLAARLYLRTDGPWIPYLLGGVGLLWTSLDVVEIDRTFNFQHFIGVGWRQNRVRGPRLIVELRNHHISNAGTAGTNWGVNALMVLSGVEWVLSPSPRGRVALPHRARPHAEDSRGFIGGG